MADVPVPPPPPPPPPGDLLGNSLPQPPPISGGNASITPSQSGSSLYSASGSSEVGSVSNDKDGLGKRPATIDEVRQSARKWSLAGDAGVLLYLQKFSQNMILKTHELEKVVDNLAYETKGLNSKVHNTFNDFLMLSNKQFIENRVYDEEVSQEEPASKDAPQQQNKSREQLEAEILPRFSQAVNLGFQVLEDAFITVELKPSEESDDEDEESLPTDYVPDPIIEPKDMYSSRPLPHLIGSAEFFSDDTLGLVENDDEEEEERQKKKKEDSDESETSESDEESESEYSESSEEEMNKSIKKKQVSDDSESEEESESDEDLFGETKKKPIHDSEETDESEDDEISQPKTKIDIQAELAAKLGVQSQIPKSNTADDNEDKLDTQSIASKKSFSDTKSVSSTVDAEKVASDAKIGKEGKHRSSSKRSEGGHKKHKGSVKQHHHHHHHHHKHKKVEEDMESDEDLFGESKEKGDKIEDASPFEKKGGMFSGGGTLFGTEPEGDLFGEIEKDDAPSPSAEKPPEPETPKEIKPRTRTTSSGKKLPAGAVSLFGGANLFSSEEDSKDNTIKEEDGIKEKDVKDDVKDTKKPPPIVKGLFDDDDENSLFDSKPKQNNLQEPPKQKRKKTLELFDDKDDGDTLFGNEDKKSVAKPTTDPKKVEVKNPSQKASGLFAGSENEKIESTPKVDGKKAAAKPKVLSLFDEDDAEEEDWFDNIKTSQVPTSLPKGDKKPETQKQNGQLFSEAQPTETKTPLAKQTKERMPSKSKKVSLFEDDDDDLFNTSSSKPIIKDTKRSDVKEKPALQEQVVEKPQKETEAKKTPKEVEKKSPEDKATKEKKDSGLSVTTKSKKGRSFIDEDDSGLFGDDQDDLFTAPIKKPTAQKKDAAPTKKPKTSGISFLDDDDDDFFGVPSQAAKSKVPKVNTEPIQAPKSEKKWEIQISPNPDTTRQNLSDSTKPDTVGSNDVLGKDDNDDLFNEQTVPYEKKVPNVQTPKEVPKVAETDETPQQKPKKLAGAVSLFGGLDPFAAKKTLRSASKEEAQPTSHDISKDDSLFSITNSKQDLSPTYSDPTAQPAAPSHPSKVAEKEKSPPKEEIDGTTKESKKTPNIVLDPGTLIPGARPPQRPMESPPASFDDPPPLQTLSNPNKGRAKIQQKRRPPTRQMRQGQISSEQNIATSVDVPGTIIGNTSHISISKAKVDTKKELEESPSSDEKTTGRKKSLRVEDIFSEDDDDIFGSTRTQPIKQEERKTDKSIEKTVPTRLPDNVVVTNNAKTESIDGNSPNIRRPDSDLVFGDTNDVDDIFSITKDPSIREEKAKADISNAVSVADDSSVTGKKNLKSESVEEISRSQGLSGKEETGGKESEDDDLFKPSETKEKKVIDSNKDKEDGKGKKEEVGKAKKKKEKASIFSEGVEDDLFSGATKKKESNAAKKTKKSSKIVTDEDLFGDTGSIFDAPSKTKEKKKKKSEGGKDISNAKDDDIFATGGGERKAKTKKKAERKVAGKASKSQVNDSEKAPDIFDDPLNVLGGD